MSLHTLANHLQSAGRGEDKVLVHMTPGEVNGLQSLAMAHGGSLSINPQTGLPEAGFLKSLLPMAIGFGLAPFTGGMSAALITGAGYTAATGSLKKGIMAGLGAYGGAGLASGLTAMGAQGASAGAAGAIDDVALASKNAAANSQIGAGYGNITAQPQVFGQPAVSASNTVLPAYTPPPVTPTYAQTQANMLQSPMFQTTPPAPSVVDVNSIGGRTLDPRLYGGPDSSFVQKLDVRPDGTFTPNAYTAGDPTSPYRINPQNTGYGNVRAISPDDPLASLRGKPPIESRIPTPVERGVVRSELLPGGPSVAAPQSITGSASDYMSQLGRGAKASFSSMEGLKGLYNAMPTGSVVASGLTLAEAMKPEPLDEKKDKSLIRPYDFEYNPTGVASEPYSGSGERVYFNPTFTARTPYEAPGPEYAANGGLMGYAVGGPVERMSAMNSVGMNTGYPMANINTPTYTNSAIQDPEATNIIAPSADVGVGAYTGEERFRSGGSTKEPESSGYKYDYNPQTMQFTQTGGPTTAKPPSPELAAFDMAKRFNEMQATGKPYNFTPSWAQGASLSDGPVTGGMAQPIMQPQSPAQPLIPNINIPAYQTPEQQLGLGGFYNMMNQQMGSFSGYAAGGNVGGISHLGDYSDGGRLLKGPGDGVSDSIPASIGNRQPARLADGEFVVPARIVSEIGNGSTEAGARKLYAMMERVQRARRKTTGKGRVAVNTKSEKLLPA